MPLCVTAWGSMHYAVIMFFLFFLDCELFFILFLNIFFILDRVSIYRICVCAGVDEAFLCEADKPLSRT